MLCIKKNCLYLNKQLVSKAQPRAVYWNLEWSNSKSKSTEMLYFRNQKDTLESYAFGSKNTGNYMKKCGLKLGRVFCILPIIYRSVKTQWKIQRAKRRVCFIVQKVFIKRIFFLDLAISSCFWLVELFCSDWMGRMKQKLRPKRLFFLPALILHALHHHSLIPK